MCSFIWYSSQKWQSKSWHTWNYSWRSSGCADCATYWGSAGLAYTMARVPQTLWSREWIVFFMLQSWWRARCFIMQGIRFNHCYPDCQIHLSVNAITYMVVFLYINMVEQQWLQFYGVVFLAWSSSWYFAIILSKKVNH